MNKAPIYVWSFDKGEDMIINRPSYYNTGRIEVLDFILDQNLNFPLGNVVKYVCRAGKKDKEKYLEDLKKAQVYLDRFIRSLEESE